MGRVAEQDTVAGHGTLAATVKVWDLLVRIFHWSLVTLFIGAFATGDENDEVHTVIGYAIALLVTLRVVWGFVGPRFARFSDFVRSPIHVARYLRNLTAGTAQRALAHNPAGGAMIVALLLMLFSTCATGFAMTTAAFWGSKMIEDIHGTLAYLTVALIAVHVAGVAISSLLHRENLVWAMITGRKRSA
jgi:cytochrome b